MIIGNSKDNEDRILLSIYIPDRPAEILTVELGRYFSYKLLPSAP